MNKTNLISLRYNYSPKKIKNICKFLIGNKPTLSELKLKIEKTFSKTPKLCVPNYKHRKGQNHVAAKFRTTKLPGGFFPSEKQNSSWKRTIEKYLYENPFEKDRIVNRYYYHVETYTSGTKFLRVSRKRIRAAKRKHVITIYLELL